LKAFIVSLNGEKLIKAGIGPNGVLSTIVTWVGGGRRPRGGDLLFSVGGLDSRSDEHVRWHTPELKVGDTVTVRIVESKKVDPENERYPPDLSPHG
jgi:hypothetical protein